MQRSSTSFVIAFACLLAALVVTSTAKLSATSSILSTWQARYSTSLSDDNTAASGRVCYLCHGATNSEWNAYGWRIKLGIDAGLTAAQAIAAAETFNSDGDPGGFSNLDEITENAQPGWTSGPNNTIFTTGGSTSGQLPPAGIAGNLDPVVVQEPDINLNPTALDFGTVLVGQSVLRTAAIENTGTADLTVSGIARCAGTSTEYTWSPDAFPITVPPGGSQTLSVFYAPVDAGVDSGCLELSSNDPNENPAVLNVVGEGTPPTVEEPDINLVPSSLSFGTILIGNTSQLTAQIQNLGNASLSISSIARCGGTSTEFTWLNSVPITVPAGGSVNLQVGYTPIDEGTDTGCLELATNDPDENPVQLGLAGTGQQPPTTGVDLDIARLRVSHTARLSGAKGVSIALVVVNRGSLDQPRQATVVGMQNGVQVYSETMMVSAPAGGGRATFNFPAFAPGAAGDVIWTATIADDDPDVDQASAATRVR